MEGMVPPQEGSETVAEPPTMGFVQRFFGMYTNPQETFEDINRKGSWLGMFVIMAILGAAVAYLPQTRMDHETYMRKALEMNPMTKNLSEEQIKQVIERPQGAFQKYSTIVFVPISMMVAYLAIAGVFLLVLVLMGAGLTYKKTLSFTIWGMTPPGVIGSLLGILMIFLKDPETLDIDSSGNLVSNLGPLVSKKEHAVLHSLLGSIDLFSVWVIFLLAVGFSVASGGKLSRGKAAGGVILCWALYVAAKLGFTAIFS